MTTKYFPYSVNKEDVQTFKVVTTSNKRVAAAYVIDGAYSQGMQRTCSFDVFLNGKLYCKIPDELGLIEKEIPDFLLSEFTLNIEESVIFWCDWKKSYIEKKRTHHFKVESHQVKEWISKDGFQNGSEVSFLTLKNWRVQKEWSKQLESCFLKWGEEKSLGKEVDFSKAKRTEHSVRKQITLFSLEGITIL